MSSAVINLISLRKNYHEGRPPVPLPLCPPRPSVGGRLAAKAAREGILWGGPKAAKREREGDGTYNQADEAKAYG